MRQQDILERIRALSVYADNIYKEIYEMNEYDEEKYSQLVRKYSIARNKMRFELQRLNESTRRLIANRYSLDISNELTKNNKDKTDSYLLF